MKARTVVKVILGCVLAILLGLSCLAGSLVLMVGGRISGKDGAPRSMDQPRARPDLAAEPIPQLENHTCGLLSLSAAYKVFGLSPEAKNLRVRLGVDTPAQPLDSTSTGTLHPDIFRVLEQDGFDYELVDPAQNGASRIESLVGAGCVVMTLIRRPESGGLHWVLIDGAEATGLRVVDSLRPEPTLEPAEEFVRSRVLSLLALRPANGTPQRTGDANLAGVEEMRRVRTRLSSLPPRESHE